MSFLFSCPLAVIRKAAGRLRQQLAQRMHAELLKATGLPDSHGRQG